MGDKAFYQWFLEGIIIQFQMTQWHDQMVPEVTVEVIHESILGVPHPLSHFQLISSQNFAVKPRTWKVL